MVVGKRSDMSPAVYGQVGGIDLTGRAILPAVLAAGGPPNGWPTCV
jgi:hypothetical protein